MRLPLSSVRGRLLALFVFAAAVRLLLWAVDGTHPAGDTMSYVRACGSLAQEPLGLFTQHVGWEYVGFLVPFCLTSLGGTVPDAWMVVQLVASAAVPVLLVAIGGSLGNRGAGWLAGLAYAVLPEAIQWDLRLLTDAWFTLLLTVAFWLLVRPAPTPRWAAPAVLGLLAVSRPFGVPLVAGIVLMHALTGALPRVGLGRRGAAAAVVVLPTVQQLLSWRQDWTEALFPGLWQQGYVVHDDAALLLPSDAAATSVAGYLAADPLHFLLLVVAKTVAFFVPVWPRFSLLHNVINLVSLAPIVVLGLWGVARAARSRSAAGLLGLAVVGATTAVVAGTFIDFDWRYRLPLMPVLTLFAALVAFPAAAQAWPRPGGWASRPLRRVGVADEHLDALRAVAATTPWDEVEETAVPSYVHPNPLVRWLFGRRVEVSLDMLGDPPRRVLDVGCGGGLLLAAALRRGHDATGIDLDTRPAVAAGLADRVAEGDADDLPEGPVDVLVAMDVLEHLRDLSPFLRGARRSLAPGGRLVVSGPSESALYRLGRRVAGYDGHYHERNIADILDALRADGWTIERRRRLPPVPGLFTVAVLRPPEAP